jgi:hypothetical protein
MAGERQRAADGHLTLEAHPDFSAFYAQYALQVRGWDVSFRSITSRDVLSTPSGAALACMDGRPDDSDKVQAGPKIAGGGYLILGELTDNLNEAVRIVSASGFRFGLHGDTQREELGCGFGSLHATGQLPLKYQLVLHPRALVAQLSRPDLAGVYRRLHDEHQEQELEINPFQGTTRVRERIKLATDIWYPLQLGMEQRRVLDLTAQAIEVLGLPRRAVILQSAEE